jgi:hypothetical protein
MGHGGRRALRRSAQQSAVWQSCREALHESTVGKRCVEAMYGRESAQAKRCREALYGSAVCKPLSKCCSQGLAGLKRSDKRAQTKCSGKALISM